MSVFKSLTEAAAVAAVVGIAYRVQDSVGKGYEKEGGKHSGTVRCTAAAATMLVVGGIASAVINRVYGD